MKILVATQIHSDALETLRAQHDVICAFNGSKEVLQSKIVDREALIFRSGVQITADVMACAPDLRLLIRGGSGMDNVDLDYVRKNGIHLVRVPGPGAKAVAEMTFGLMLALARNILPADRLLREGHWTKHEMTGYQLRGKTLGIIGAGNIGSRTGELGVAWGMNVIGCVEHPTTAIAERLAAKGMRLVECDDVLVESDFVALHVPLKESTRGLIDARALSLMKPGAYLVNMARGGVVDEAALLEALQAGRLRGAALDVHEQEGEGKISPLAGLSNVVLTPHIGAGTYDSQSEIGEIILQTVKQFSGEQALEPQVNGQQLQGVVVEA